MTNVLLLALLVCVVTGAFDFIVIVMFPERRNRVWVFFSGVMSILSLLIVTTLLYRGLS